MYSFETSRLGPGLGAGLRNACMASRGVKPKLTPFPCELCSELYAVCLKY